MKWISRFMLFFALVTTPFLVSADSSSRLIEDLSSYEVGEFPSSFRTYPFQRGKAVKVYSVGEEMGHRFLTAKATAGDGTSIFRRFDWDVDRWPRFSWRWRGITLPHEAKTNDCACGVYVIFGGTHGQSIKYVWSTTAETGKVIEYQPKKLSVVVKESGAENLGSWQTVDVNILEDYRKLFQSDAEPHPSGFAILTDGDNTRSPSACDYTDFSISNINAP